MDYKTNLLNKIKTKTAVVGIIGMGYVGLPLALRFAEKGFKVIGFDIDELKVIQLNSGNSYIKHIPESRIQKQVSSNRFSSTSDFSLLTSCNAIIICVPTPLTEHREPDITFVKNSGKTIAKYLQKGQLVVLESSTYPGTTEEILLPLFTNVKSEIQDVNRTTVQPTLDSQSLITRFVEAKTRRANHQSPASPSLRRGEPITDNPVLSLSDDQSPITDHSSLFTVGESFFLAFSPEREDPGNKKFHTGNIPKIVGGITKDCLEVSSALYSKIVYKVVKVSSCKVAESAKLLENIYRSVNIALVNELKMIFGKMGIDVWEVIEAAKTKPFGFQAFYPGPGLGGHCIPIDPFYLAWKAREYDIPTRFIELAGEINTHQPYNIVEKVIEVLSKSKIVIYNSKILILGVSYKKNIDDMRESPALKLIEILQSKGANVDYHDPYVPKLPPTRKYNFELTSIPLTSSTLATYDCIILVTDHETIDYKLIIENCELIIDTRNTFETHGIKSEKIFKA